MSGLRISNKTAQMLEWPEFLHFYSAFTTSAAARERIHQIAPVTELSEELDLSREALLCAQQDQAPSLGALEDVSPLVQKASIENHVCEGIELYRIYKLAAINDEIRNRISGWSKEFPKLHSRCAKVPDLRFLEQEIFTKIEPNGDVKEDATPELKRIGKQILNLKSRLEHAVEKFFRDSRYRNALQEDYVTYRHGRAVLLLRSDEKSSIRGIVHGESGSGASLFVEPFSIVELNNELAQLTDRQQEEIRRILKELTALIGRNSDVLLFALQLLIALDLILARGRFGIAYRCTVPEMTDDFRMNVRDARHPLLESALQKQGKQVVPATFELRSEKKALVITGPNTGGKTVFLKTIGLLSIMAHCALPIPAEDGTVLPRLNALEADIGDQQSIAESLSTFSSHITNIVGILSRLQDRSMIFLDELGTGTDPEEGAPLAVAILRELLQRNIKVFVTSHHSQIKVFAFNHPECVTAAMEFDQQNLEPTYRVHMEELGASHALEMAERLGVPSSILHAARDLAGQEQRQLREFQTNLQERIRDLEQSKEALEKEKIEWEAQAREQKEQIDSVQEKLEQQRKKLKEQNVDLVRTLNAKVETLLDKIRDGQIRQQLRKQYKQDVAPVMEQLEETTASQAPVPRDDFRPGDRVWVNLYKDFGEVVAIKRDNAELLMRNKRFVVPVATLEKKEPLIEKLPKGVEMKVEKKDVSPELNLIGQTVEEAQAAVDKYLDDAFLSQLPEVRLIHGHGTGRLKKAIAEMLETHPHVRNFHPAPQDRGGSAVTVVELKAL